MREEGGRADWKGTRESIGVNITKMHDIAYENAGMKHVLMCYASKRQNTNYFLL